MSTRAIVAYKTKDDKWEGVFNHWDGYPSGLGKEIWEILHNDFIDNKGAIGITNCGTPENAVKAFIDIMIKGHGGGWSTFGKICHCHSPAFVLRDGLTKMVLSEKDLKDTWCEYLYVLDPTKASMDIFTITGGGTKLLKTVKLTGAEPNWDKIE